MSTCIISLLNVSINSLIIMSKIFLPTGLITSLSSWGWFVQREDLVSVWQLLQECACLHGVFSHVVLSQITLQFSTCGSAISSSTCGNSDCTLAVSTLNRLLALLLAVLLE